MVLAPETLSRGGPPATPLRAGQSGIGFALRNTPSPPLVSPDTAAGNRLVPGDQSRFSALESSVAQLPLASIKAGDHDRISNRPISRPTSRPASRPLSRCPSMQTFREGVGHIARVRSPSGTSRRPSLEHDPYVSSRPDVRVVAPTPYKLPTSSSATTPPISFLSPPGSPTGRLAPPSLAEQEEAFLDHEEDEQFIVFEEGDMLGPGFYHQGHRIIDCFADRDGTEVEPLQLEVVRQLGSGSYAIVYLVRQVLYDPPEGDEGDEYSLDDEPQRSTRTYGKEFALKCLSKTDLTEELEEVQKYEATLHRSLPNHPNIVALHRVSLGHSSLTFCSRLIEIGNV
jgi:hypothetical protein